MLAPLYDARVPTPQCFSLSSRQLDGFKTKPAWGHGSSTWLNLYPCGIDVTTGAGLWDTKTLMVWVHLPSGPLGHRDEIMKSSGPA